MTKTLIYRHLLLMKRLMLVDSEPARERRGKGGIVVCAVPPEMAGVLGLEAYGSDSEEESGGSPATSEPGSDSGGGLWKSLEGEAGQVTTVKGGLEAGQVMALPARGGNLSGEAVGRLLGAESGDAVAGVRQAGSQKRAPLPSAVNALSGCAGALPKRARTLPRGGQEPSGRPSASLFVPPQVRPGARSNIVTEDLERMGIQPPTRKVPRKGRT